MRVRSTPSSSAAGAHPVSVQLDDNAGPVESELLLGLLEELNTEGFFTGGDLTKTEVEPENDDDISTDSEVVGTTASQLESLKELIRFDHEYYKKPVERVQNTDKDTIAEQSDAVPDNKQPETFVPDLGVSLDTEPVLMDIADIYDNVGGFDCDLTDLLNVDNVRHDSYSDSGISDAESSDFPASPLTESNDWQDTFTDLFPSLGVV